MKTEKIEIEKIKTEKIKIKKIGLDKLDVLMEWRMRVLREVFSLDSEGDFSEIRKNNEEYYRKHIPESTHTACFAVDKESGRILGCGGICYQEEMPSPDNLTGKNGYLMNIFTLPQFRGKGIGLKIVEFLVEDAKKRGTGKIYLESSAAAEKLYRKTGFEPLEGYMFLAEEDLKP